MAYGPLAGQHRAVRIQTLESTDAFVAIDLEETVSSGPVRWARKILQGGAQDLARSQTYTYAALGIQRGGASAGISAEAADRAAAVKAFVDEAAGLVESGTYLPDPAKGVSEEDLAPLRQSDPRNTSALSGDAPMAVVCEAAGATAAADAAVGLEGRSVAIEGFADSGPALIEAVTARGAKVVAIATTTGSVSVDGIEAEALGEAWAAHGPDLVSEIGEPDPAWKIFTSGAEVLFAGSKMGAVDHDTAGRLDGVVALVPIGRLPFTAKALAVFRRAGVAALPDFVTLAGSTLAVWAEPSETAAAVRSQVEATVGSLTREAMTAADGPFLGACYAAESFLRTWQDTLPFGRPLAP